MPKYENIVKQTSKDSMYDSIYGPKGAPVKPAAGETEWAKYTQKIGGPSSGGKKGEM